MIELLSEEVKKIDNQKYKTIIVCVGFGCLSLTAIAGNFIDKYFK